MEICGYCKYWKPIGWNKEDGFVQDKDEDGTGYGWCRINPPIAKKDTQRASWPETKECHYCAKFESKQTEVDRWRDRYWSKYSEWNCAAYRLGKSKKTEKAIIKAIKKKYPKIRINKKAIEKALEIIEQHSI